MTKRPVKRRTKTSPGPAPRARKVRDEAPKPDAAPAARVDIAPYVPLPGESELVCVAVAAGVSEDAMLAVVGKGQLTPDRFRGAFSRELTHGKDIATLKVAASLFMMATSRQKGLAPTSAIFWMKGMAGWSDGGGNSATVTVKSKGGEASGPVDPAQIVEVSFKIGDDTKIKDEG